MDDNTHTYPGHADSQLLLGPVRLKRVLRQTRRLIVLGGNCLGRHDCGRLILSERSCEVTSIAWSACEELPSSARDVVIVSVTSYVHTVVSREGPWVLERCVDHLINVKRGKRNDGVLDT